MNRRELDAFVAHHELPRAGIEAALDVAGARPGAGEIRQWTVRLLQLAGVLSLAAGFVFFIAANWQELRVAGRFVLVQIVLVASVAVALWKPPQQPVGRYALLVAFIATGVLLALFGQTYQTGADIYELFLTWAVLGLPFVVAGQWSVIGAAWLAVMNLALMLFFSWRPQGGWLWVVFSSWHTNIAVLLLVPTVVNLLLWMLAEYLDRTRWHALTPRWIARLALASAFGFATWAGIYAVLQAPMEGAEGMALIVVLGLEAAVAVQALRKRSDVFPLALAAASLIMISTCALGAQSGANDVGLFFMLALWLVASSTISGRFLMSLVRTWRLEEETA